MEGAINNRGRKAQKKAEKKPSVMSFVFNASSGIDFTFLILVLLLLSIGLVMLFSSSYANALFRYNNAYTYISSQATYAVAGVLLMLLVSTFNYKILERVAWPLFFITIPLLVAVYFNKPVNDAHRWIFIGSFQFQPSEIAKFMIVILFAHMINLNYDRMKTFRYGLMPFIAVLAPVAALILFETHLSGTILVLGIAAIMMIIGGANLKWFAAVGIIAGIGLVIVVTTGLVSVAMPRINSWLHPFDDMRGQSFQTIQSLYAIGSGGFMGLGIGGSRQKFLYLPEPQNDFIFAIVCEELGFVGASAIIVIFALLVWRGYVIGMRCKDRFGSLVAIGLTTQVGLQTVLNIMVVTNTIPNTGISLPFFSYGGTALIMLLVQMGVVLSISRHTAMEKQ